MARPAVLLSRYLSWFGAAAITLFLAMAARADKAPPTPRVDLYGDPLPEGAIARLGTVRLNHGAPAFACSYINDGKVLISYDWGGTLRYWDRDGGTELRHVSLKEIVGSDPNANLFSIAPDGNSVALAPVEGDIRVLDVARKKIAHKIPKPKFARWEAIDFVANGSCLFALGRGVGYVYGAADGKLLDRFFVTGFPAWSETILADVDPDRLVEMHSFVEKRPPQRFGPIDVEAMPSAATMSRDGHRLAVALDARTRGLRAIGRDNSDSRIVVYDASNCQAVRSIRHPGGPTNQLALSADATSLFVVSAKGTPPNRGRATAWDLGVGKKTADLFDWPGGDTPVVFSSDGRYAASTAPSGAIIQWALPSWKVVRETHGTPITSMAFAPNRELIATADDNSLRLWNVQDGQPLARIARPRLAPSGLTFSPDSRAIAAILYGEVVLFDARTLDEYCRRRLPSGVRCLAFSGDGARLAVGAGSSVYLLETKSLTPVVELATTLARGPQGFELAGESEIITPRNLDWSVESLAFSPDGALLAAAEKLLHDGAASIWDLKQRRERHVLHNVAPHSSLLSFSPDGAALVMAPATSPKRETALLVADVLSGEQTTGALLPSRGPAFLMTVGSRLSLVSLSQSSAAGTSQLRFQDARTGDELVKPLDLGIASKVIAISPGFEFVAVAAGDGTSLIFELPSVGSSE